MNAAAPVLRGALACLLAWVGLVPLPRALAQDAPPEVAFDEEDLVILEVHLDKYVLGDGILAYMRPEGLYLPLGELAELLDFPILVDPYAGRANGWFIQESRGFQLAVLQGEVVIEGEAAGFDPELVKRDVTEIFVEASLLSSWFGVEFEVILARLELRLHPSVKLPLQQRLLREERRRSGLSGRGRPDQLPRRTAPYRMASWPSADVTLRSSVSGGDADSSYTFFGSADLAGIAWETSASGSTNEPLSNLRLLGSRTDIDGDLLGPLGLRVIHFGDISTPSVPLVSRVQQGPGLYASNANLVRSEEFASTSVRGNAPAGWEVELYRNGALLDFLNVDRSGRYEFPRVEIGFGENVLRTVAYGPQGQIRERIERHRVGASMLRPGELHYRLFAVRPERSLLDGWVPSLQRVGSRRSDGWDLHGQLEYGMGTQLSVMAGVTHAEVNDSYKTFGNFALRASSRGILAEAELARSAGGGSALRFSTQTRLWGVTLLLQQSLFRSYSNNVDPGSSQLSRETLARAESSLIVPHLPPIAYAIRVERQSFEDRAARDRSLVSLRTASNARGIAFSHELNLQKPGGVSNSPRRMWSQALISGRIHGFQLRGRAQYEWKPDAELKVVTGSVSRDLRRDLRATIGVSHSRGPASETNLSSQVSWLHRKFELGFELSHSSRRGTTAALTIGSSFGREPRSGQLMLQRRSLASNGSALARVFLDRNANDVFDAGDEPVQDISFLGNSAWRNVRTDTEGRAFLPGVPVNRPHNVKIDASSLIDPFWVPATPGYAVVGHAGGQVEIDFPIRLAGEIDGTAYLERDGERRPRRNLKLELLDAQDVVAQTLRSSFDGYFLFEGVLPGRYRIRVASSAIQDPGIQAAEIDLEVPAYGGAVSGLELILRATGEAASATKTMPQQKAKPERKAEPERTRRESPSDEDGPICSPLARVLLKRRAWAPRGSVEVGECLRARRQAEDAGEQVIETRESTEEHRQPQTEEHSESQTLDEGDPQGPPLGTILTPARDERTSKAQERMGIRDLRSAQGLLGGNPCIVQPSDMGDNDESSCRPPSLPPRSHGNRLPPDERRAEGRDYGHFKTRASVALSMEPAEARARAPPRIRSNKVPSM